MVFARLGPEPVPRSTGGVETGRAGVSVMMRRGGKEGAFEEVTLRCKEFTRQKGGRHLK